MRKTIIILLMLISWLAIRESIYQQVSDFLNLREQVVIIEVEQEQNEKPKKMGERQAEVLAYPAPEEPDWPYIPPPDYSHETPLPTPDLSILPTPAPTMNPWGD